MFAPSRIYHYVRARQLEGTYPGDGATGVWPITVFRIMKGWGSIREGAWAYPSNDDDWPPQEPPGVDEIAKRERLFAYHRTRSIGDCAKALNANHSITAAFEIDDSWTNPVSGIIPPPKGRPTGSHTVFLIEFRPEEQRFLFQNSWGMRWGCRGTGTLPPAYF